MKPWERYQQAQPTQELKPWERYQQASQPVEQPVEQLVEQPTGFSAGQKERGAELADILSAEQNPLSTGLQVAGHIAGTAGDVLGKGVELAAKGVYNVLPEAGQKRISSDLERFGTAIAPIVQQYESNLEAYNKMYPERGRNLQAVRNIGQFLPVGVEPVKSVVKGGVKASGKAFKNVGKEVAAYPVEGVTTVAKGLKPLSDTQRLSIRNKFDEAADVHYKAVRESGATLKPEKTDELLKNIDTALAGMGRLNPALHPKTMAVLDNITKDLNEGILDVGRIDQNRRILSRIKKGIEGAEDYGAARAAVREIDKFEDMLGKNDFIKGTPEAIEQLRLGRESSHKARKVEKINNIITNAKGDPNRIKAGLTRFVTNPKNLDKNGKLVGFTPEEDFMVKRAASSTTAEKILKMGGKFGIDLGTSLTPGNTVAPVIGGAVAGSGAGAAAVVGTGTVMRQLQKYMARGKADDVIRAIQKGKTPKELMDLPPKEAKSIIEAVKGKE